jgi:uncharacterized protein
MPSALALADYSTYISLLLVLAGASSLLLSVYPPQAGSVKFTPMPARRALIAFMPLSVIMAGFLLRGSNRVCKYSGALLGLLAGLVAAIGLWRMLSELITYLASTKKIKRRRAFEFLAAHGLLLILVLAAAVPYVGWFMVFPTVALLSAAKGAEFILLAGTRRLPPPQKARRKSGLGFRIVQCAIALLLLTRIAPIYATASIVHIDALIETFDGVHLAITVYMPRKPGPFPVLFLRTPYNRKSVKPTGFVSAGYAVVVEDSRGRFGSQGENLPFEGDAFERPNDSWETLTWLSKQTWCNGNIATLGGSASGISQLALAASGSDALKAQDIEAATDSFYQHGLYPGGIFRQNLAEKWLASNEFSKDALKIWKSHPDFDDYWYRFDLTDKWGNMHWPALHVGGWYDIFSQGTLDAFTHLNLQGGYGAAGNQKLVMGPWSHSSFYQERTGDFRFPGASNVANPKLTGTGFLDIALNHKEDLNKLPAVTYYTMGSDERGAPGNLWQTSSEWPPRDSFETPYYLHGKGMLNRTRPSNEPPTSYTFDPAQPAPTLGGAHLFLPSGPVDQRELIKRSDVVKFSTDPLNDPIEVTGNVHAELWISTDVPDTDLFVKLCDVYPDGRTINICEGQLRTRFRYGFLSEEYLQPGVPALLNVDMWSTSMVFNKGHKLAILITSSNSGEFEVNTNSLDSASRTAHINLLQDPDHPSSINLPVRSVRR